MDATTPAASSFLRNSEDCAQFLVDGNPELLDLTQAHGHDQFPLFWKDPFGRRDFRRAALKRAMPRLAIALSVWTLGLYFNNVSQAWLERDLATYYEAAWQQRSGPPVLWDFGYHALPGKPSTEIANAWPAVAFITATVRFMVIPGPMSMRWTICCRVFLLWGVLWGLRSLTLVATVLPNPDPSCKPRIKHPDNIWLEALAILPIGQVTWAGPQVTCHDVLYSGHTVALTLAILIYMRYLDWAPWFAPSASNNWFIAMMKFVLGLCLFAGYYVIVASRFHYTIDVMVGALFTLLVWKGYHGLVRQQFLPQRKSPPSSLAEGVQLFVCWFEADAVDVKAFQLALKGLP